ncbi:MAG: putative CRISPR-associated protein [Trueperaceae bacterium]|nr:putative CRISPR-associated protein [Trueperaceae bacterium]
MNNNLLLLSTCGTSVLTNNASEEDRRWLHSITNLARLTKEDQARLDAMARERAARLRAASEPERRRMSAELNGAYAAMKQWPAKTVHHLLVHTDTAAGKAVAEIIEGGLMDTGSVSRLSAPGLRTDDAACFRDALSQLTREIEASWSGNASGWDDTVFNLTGGFKSVNAYLQALGMVYRHRCVFLFEGAEELMEIPRLPVQLAEAAEIRPYLKVFRRIIYGYPVTPQEAAGLPQSLLTEMDGLVTTNFWGDAVWGRVSNELLGEALLEPISTKLNVTKVAKSVAALEPKRRVQANRACDALAANLDGKRPLTKAHTFKALGGNPVPPATHELYLWSDEDTGRLWGHFEGSRFVADSIGSHLK